MATAAAAPKLHICGVLLESSRIIKPNSRHFQALYALFLLPISSSLLIYLNFQVLSLFESNPNKHIQSFLALPLIYSLFIFILTICAVGTITYSTHHGFYGRPVELVSSIKSLSHTFIPLAATTLISYIIVILIALFAELVIRGMELYVSIYRKYSDYYFNWFRAVVWIIYVVVVLYVQVNWSLASVIVVVESKWGLDALRRSKYLVRGMRWVSFLIMYMYGGSIVLFVWGSVGLVLVMNNMSYWWKILWVVMYVVSVFYIASCMRTYIVAFSVMYCKLMARESASATEYVRLPFDDDNDDDKVPIYIPHHVVDVAAQV